MNSGLFQFFLHFRDRHISIVKNRSRQHSVRSVLERFDHVRDGVGATRRDDGQAA